MPPGIVCNRCSRCECEHDGLSTEKQFIRKRGRPPGNHCHSPQKKTKDINSTRPILRAGRENLFLTQNDLDDEDETWMKVLIL